MSHVFLLLERNNIIFYNLYNIKQYIFMYTMYIIYYAIPSHFYESCSCFLRTIRVWWSVSWEGRNKHLLLGMVLLYYIGPITK